MAILKRRGAYAVVLSILLAACGGGGGGSGSSAADPTPPPPVVVEKPATRNEAARFLTQATFGPTDAAIKAANANNSAGQSEVYETFWKQALTGPDQLRQRVAFALSQIFVISLVDGTVGDNPRAVAAWMDMLGDKGLTTYRELLESVSRHPMMGAYLSHLRNQKADARTGRVPDENYAREVMQLFSIGLVELNQDGSAKTGTGGGALETYTPTDISGLAKVFTGWSYACPDWPDNNCFFSGSNNGNSDPDRSFKPLLGYAQYHSAEEKRFLGTTIATQATSDPTASLRTALDALAAHTNVGPFIGKQLIQRFVTSNPSPAYVSAVSGAFANNGKGVRGDMKTVLKAVLMNPEARVVSDSSGKLREPVLRLSAFMRAFPHRSDTGNFKVGNTDNPGTALGQTAMRSPSVFNFYRPGFVPPGTQTATRNLVSPEMQLASETAAAGFVNYMRDNIASGVGSFNGTVNGVALNRRDLQGDYTSELALASDVPALVDRVATRLAYGNVGAALAADITAAVTSISIPALNTGGTNQAQIDSAKRNRVNAAILLVLASPEFAVQK